MAYSDWSTNPDLNGLADASLAAVDTAPARKFMPFIREVMAGVASVAESSTPIVLLSFARAGIAAIAIPAPLMTFAVAGYTTPGDLGRGAPYKAGTSTGPGAIQDKLERWFEVDCDGPEIRPEWFGAFADGSTDCTNGINQAEASASVRGSTVRFSCGTYLVRGVTKRTRSQWVGAGTGLTVIKLMRNTTATAVVAGLNAYTLRGGTSVSEGVFEFEIQRITIDGNRADGGRSDGIGLYGAVFKLSEYEIRNCFGTGQWTEFPFGGIPSGQKNVQSQFYNGYVHECGKGVEYGGPNDSEWYSVYSYLNDEANLRTYGAGSGKFTQCHMWCDSIAGPQVTTNIQLDSPGNIFMGCAIEGAKREQIWCRANDQLFVGCVTFYNQLEVAGRIVTGIRIGDDGVSPGTKGYAEVQGIRYDGTIRNCHRTVHFEQDRGYHTIEADGFTVRQNSSVISGQQWLENGLPTSELKLRIRGVTDGVNPAPAGIRPVWQSAMKPSFFQGITVSAGTVGIGVGTAQVNLDHAGGRWHREADGTGALFVESFTGSGGMRSALDKQNGPYGNWAFNAYGTDQITLTSLGVKQFGLGPYATDAAAGAAGIPQGLSYKRTDGTWAYKL